jgi:hypothetical protein
VVASSAGFYFVGVKAMLSLSMRYVLPLSVLGSAAAGIALGHLLEARRWKAARLSLVAASIAFICVYGIDVTHLMLKDARYRAESWLAGHTNSGTSIETYQRDTYLPRFQNSGHIEAVSFSDRNSAAFMERRPQYVVLSSAGMAGITVKYKTDWQADAVEAKEWIPAQTSVTGKVMNYHNRRNLAFLEDLRSGRLGYVEAARFNTDPWIKRPILKSLNPEIVVYERPSDRTAGQD